MKLERIWALAVSFSAVIVLIAFQNCSDVKVSERASIPPPPPPVRPLAKPEGSLCAPQGVVFGAPVRIVIILDMSASNVGTVIEEVDEANFTTWTIDTSDGPTDLAGARFEQIKNFILNCGSSTNVKYSIIGFSNSHQFVRGQSCVSPFESQEDAVRTVEAFKAQQDADVRRGRVRGDHGYPFSVGTETNYIPALSCLDQKISEDLMLLEGERPAYQTFFMTDGQSTDSDANLIANLTAKINLINMKAMSDASGFRFQGIYYTSPGAKNGGAQQAQALANLTAITQVTEGPSGAAINITDLSATQAQLCSRLQPSSRVDYNLKSIFAVNLSSLMRKNVIEADSDMDGVSDKEEAALGWAPDNYRSTGAIDGLCYWSSRNKTQCSSVAAGLTCSRSSFNFGLSECDKAFANKLYGRPLVNADIDKDAVPNFIEIIRGTSLARSDMLDNPTADGFNNYLKITKGMDVAASISTWPIDDDYLMDFKFTVEADACANGLDQVNYQLDHIPFAENTLKYTDPSNDLAVNFSHEANENIVLVFSVWQSSGGITLPNRLYVQKWIVPKAADAKKDEVKFLGEF
ncbi:MAG: Calcium-binding acidic-repeat protein precursor [Pseudobdellovibrio sp.]|nr:Calcium-binding acidic-repeat protein precursor [Pseudobdellovibrio sp.]